MTRKNNNFVNFIGPEIRHMALSAQESGTELSYFHIISGNFSTKFDADLSNGRQMDVIKIEKIMSKIGAVIKKL